MKKALLGIVAANLIIATPALAAHRAHKTPPAPPAPAAAAAPVYNWTGFYAGLNAGGAWSYDPGAAICLNPAGVSNGTGCHVVPGTPTIHGSGFLGGAQAGYNWQSQSWVYGLEADLQGAGIDGSQRYSGTLVGIGAGNATGTSSASERLDMFGTVRGRLGITWDHVLLYATGGFAYGHAKMASSFVFASGTSYIASGSAGLTGWTAGGGLEYALSGPWSVKLEGLYYDLGSASIQAGATPVPIGLAAHGRNFDFQGAIARAGVNYKF